MELPMKQVICTVLHSGRKIQKDGRLRGLGKRCYFFLKIDQNLSYTAFFAMLEDSGCKFKLNFDRAKNSKKIKFQKKDA